MKCERCPLRGDDKPCFGEGARALCGLAGTEGGDRHIRLRSDVAAGWTPPVPEYLEPAPPPPLVPLDESLAKYRLVRSRGGRRCPHGSPASCGCSGVAACSLHGRDVTTDDCYVCLTTGPRSREV